MENYRLYEIPTFVSTSEIGNKQEVHIITSKLRSIIKESFLLSDYSKQHAEKDMSTFIAAFKFFLMQKIENQGIEILKVVDRNTDTAYLIIEDVFKEKYYFVVYNENLETAILSDDKLIEILAGRGIPDSDFDLIFVKQQTIDKQQIIKIALIVICLILIFSMLPVLLKTLKKPLPPQIISQQEKQQQRVYTKQELKSVKITAWEKLEEKWTELLEEVQKEEGVIIRKISVNLSEVDQQTSKAEFKIEIVKFYTYPEVNTKREGDVFVKLETFSESFEFKVLKDIPQFNKEQCLITLLNYFDVVERTANEVVFEPVEFKLSTKLARELVYFLKSLQKICGYNLSIQTFGIDADKDVIYVNNVKLVMEQ